MLLSSAGLVKRFVTQRVERDWCDSHPSLTFPLRDRSIEFGAERNGNIAQLVFNLHKRAIKLGLDVCDTCCRRCGETDTNVVEIDHIDGNRLNDLPKNLQLLCGNCHNRKTKGVVEVKRSYIERAIDHAILTFGVENTISLLAQRRKIMLKKR